MPDDRHRLSEVGQARPRHAGARPGSGIERADDTGHSDPGAARQAPVQDTYGDDVRPVVASLLREQAPHLAGLPLRRPPGPQGVDNVVVRVGDDLLARLPRSARTAALLAREQRWLPVLAPRLPVPVPLPVVAGRPSAAFPHVWSVVPWVEGRTADVGAYDPAALAAALVPVLRALHVPAPPDAPTSSLRGIPLRDRVERHRAALRGWPDAERLDALLVELAAVPGPTGPPVWLHGDLHPRNLVVRHGRLAGLLDFGDVCAGDRATDLAALWMLLPRAVRRDALDALDVDDGTARRARGWALVLGALLRELGRTGDDEAFLAVGHRTLEAVLEGP